MNFEDGESLTGLVLAASLELLDPNFHKTVIFIAEHGPTGALGFVMNRPLGRKLAEIAKSPEMPESMENLPVFEGGPVKPNGLLFARFGRGQNDEELVCEILADPRELGLGCVRAFAGYSGWGEGQLERELEQGSWKVCKPHVELLKDPVPPALWPAFIGEDQRWRKLQPLLPKNTGEN